jgi:hypothetical protein
VVNKARKKAGKDHTDKIGDEISEGKISCNFSWVFSLFSFTFSFYSSLNEKVSQLQCTSATKSREMGFRISSFKKSYRNIELRSENNDKGWYVMQELGRKLWSRRRPTLSELGSHTLSRDHEEWTRNWTRISEMIGTKIDFIIISSTNPSLSKWVIKGIISSSKPCNLENASEFLT